MISKTSTTSGLCGYYPVPICNLKKLKSCLVWHSQIQKEDNIRCQGPDPALLMSL